MTTRTTTRTTAPGSPEIRADRAALSLESRRWAGLADDLEAVRRTLDGVAVAGLGGRVAPVAALVLDGWAARVDTLGGAARVHGDAAAGTWRGLEASDEAVEGLYRGPLGRAS